jgi:tRNA G10  N-methylase Trm11
MLPPKLAQILINLSGAKESKSSGDHILDPFCGSGTILQEAMLLRIDCTGTDLNPKIIEDTKENLAWLDKRFRLRDSKVKFNLGVANATSHQWSKDITHIICEGYLGTPLSREPSAQKLQEIIKECNDVSEGFLKNLAPQLSKEQKLVIALPCWFVGGEVIKLPVVENLSALGYNLLKSKKNQNDLVYHREDQIVGRDIYILSKS